MTRASQHFRFRAAAVLFASLAACAAPGDDTQDAQNNTGIIQDIVQDGGTIIQDLVNGYAVFRLEADLSHLSENDREVVRLLIEASRYTVPPSANCPLRSWARDCHNSGAAWGVQSPMPRGYSTFQRWDRFPPKPPSSRSPSPPQISASSSRRRRST